MKARDDYARPDNIDLPRQAARVAALNDALRRHQTGGRLFVTAGVAAISRDALPRILDAVSAFTAFTDDNDPYGEHDFGSFEYEGHRLFWKIDYYDQHMRGGSPDPADPAATTRVLTVMLAGEY